jgi:hypothetical protein
MTNTPESEGDLLEGEVGDSEVQLAVGTVACVWNHYLRRWTGGFAVAEVLARGYRLRRLSDDYVFSHVFSTDEVMEERRKIQEPGIPGVHVDRRIADARATEDQDAGATEEQVDRFRRSTLRKRVSIMNLVTLGIAIGALSAIFDNVVLVLLFTIFLVLNSVRMYLLTPFIDRRVRKRQAG